MQNKQNMYRSAAFEITILRYSVNKHMFAETKFQNLEKSTSNIYATMYVIDDRIVLT